MQSLLKVTSCVFADSDFFSSDALGVPLQREDHQEVWVKIGRFSGFLEVGALRRKGLRVMAYHWA